MFQEDFLLVVNASKNKSKFFKRSPFRYFIASMLAGMFVGFGILLIFSIGGYLTGYPFAKIIMGACFGIALSLVVMAGSELFTGNNMIMSAGLFSRSVSCTDVIKLWIVCFIGNWLGSFVLAWLFYKAGLAQGVVGEFITTASAAKMGLSFVPLFVRGILCNILVCLAIWCSFRLKSESGKLIMIFWCLFAFITSSFEHSIANMTLLSISLFAPFEATITLSGYFYNILTVTLGNMVGGIFFVALPYYIISSKKEA
ncbi:MAG: formate/nitrite transporter family protein [Anaerocolumna sp.]